MESMLYEAALEGNTTTLSNFFEQDPLILERIIFLNRLDNKTPLHVAVSLGHADFVKEILCLKPELAGELDSRHSSPLHIASMKGYVDIVKELLRVNPDMCLARDVNGRNPLHLAATKGRIDVLQELVRSRPLAASAPTLCGETVLHLCVKHQQLEALKLLLENLNELHHLMNSKDDYGMTILDLAVADKQIETIQFLTTSTKIEVNALTANGFTSLDILAQSRGEINDGVIDRLRPTDKAVHGNFHMHNDLEQSQNDRLEKDLEQNQNDRLEKMRKDLEQNQNDWLEENRSAILVVASLIATVAFQAAVNPPHSPLENKKETPGPASATDLFHYYYDDYYLYSLKKSFLLSNTIAFLASISTILMLISGLKLNYKVPMWIFLIIMWAASTALTFTYMTALNFLSDDLYSYASSYIVFTWMCVAGLLILIHIVRGTMKITKYLRKEPKGTS